MKVTITFYGESGPAMTGLTRHAGSAAELLAVVAPLLPELAAEADAEEARYVEQRRAEREAREARHWRELRRAHARAIIGELLRARGMSSIAATGDEPRTHAVIDHAAEVLELPAPERCPAGWRRPRTLWQRWCALATSAVEHIEAGGQCVGLDLEGLDGLAEEHERCRRVVAF